MKRRNENRTMKHFLVWVILLSMPLRSSLAAQPPRQAVASEITKNPQTQVALDWFAANVMPLILKSEPRARLLVAGSDPPPAHAYGDLADRLELLGFVEDAQAMIDRCAVFVCPVLSGSGVRVKLLEAFASGIPVVSTRIGAEGLAADDGEFCQLADDAQDFAQKVLNVFQQPEAAVAMARRARAEVVEKWDMEKITLRLESSYREALSEKITSRRYSS